MSVEQALSHWSALRALSPHGCRIHLAGGEPFGDWERLLEIARRAKQAGLTPLEKIETNAFWATDEALVRRRLIALRDETDMEALVISTDPFHQQFVPIRRVRLLARVAEDVLGPTRWRARWRNWLQNGYDTSDVSSDERNALFRRWLRDDARERLNGRAAELLSPVLPRRPAEAFVGRPCREGLLRGKHVHVLPDGCVYPGTCAGINLARPGGDDLATLWHELYRWADRLDVEGPGDRPILAALVCHGPAGLLPIAKQDGFVPDPDGYASRCALCWAVRRFLALQGRGSWELKPTWQYT